MTIKTEEKSNQLYMARQPILDAVQNVHGYELFYRDSNAQSDVSDPRLATSSVLVNILNQIGMQGSVGNALAFVNINATILMTNVLDNLPPKRFVFEISEQTIMNGKLVEVIKLYHKRGYLFALDNAQYSDEYIKNFQQIMPFITYVKIDTSMTDVEMIAPLIEYYRDKKLVAQKIEFIEMFEAYKELGFEYFQGYFFAKPLLLKRNRLDPKHLGVIRIFNMLQDGTPLENVYKEFCNHNELTLQLIQYVNSLHLNQNENISNVQELLESVDKERLMQWLLLIIYSRSSTEVKDGRSIYSKHVANRIDLMVELTEAIIPDRSEEFMLQIRMIAMLSLLEDLFEIPKHEVLQNIHIDHLIQEALTHGEGERGALLNLALSIEDDHQSHIESNCEKLYCKREDIEPIIERFQARKV